MNNTTFSQQILTWYDQHGRKNLPWQKTVTPYTTWISEIMLQQTQVETVIPYYQRFTKQFPTIQTLATAPIDEILHLWTGLGYYARARNLHKTAQIIHEKHQCQFPTNINDIIALPGIGKSTAGAIASLALGQRQAILDGNVKRVLTRYYQIKGWPGTPKNHNTLWQKAEKLLPQKRNAAYTQAIMDLGATLCTKTNPNCPHCPIQTNCQAHTNNTQHLYPEKKPPKTKPTKQTTLLILTNPQNQILLTQRPTKGIWGGLWSFPDHPQHITTPTELKKHLTHLNPNITPQNSKWQQPFRHTFTHYHLDIQPIIININNIETINEKTPETWLTLEKPLKLGLPAPIKKIIETLKAEKK